MRVELFLSEETRSPGRRSLCLGKGGVHLDEGVFLGEGMHACRAQGQEMGTF